MIGERIRELRQSQGRSLADVAGKAKISVATLSRIENDKQALEIGLFLLLAKILDVPAAELIGPEGADEGEERVDPLVRRIAALQSRERTELWRELAAERRSGRNGRGKALRQLGQQVEELVAQIDFLREELEGVRKRVKAR